MKRILCFGDSNTWGYIPGAGGLVRYPESVRWTSILQQKLGSDYTVLEFGLCGCLANGKSSSPIVNTDAQSFYSSVFAASLPVDVVIIMLGTNDLKKLNNWKKGDTASGIKKFVGVTRMLSPQTKIVLAAPVILDERILSDKEFPDSAVADSKDCAAEIAELAKIENLPFFDTNSFVTERSEDGCHFTEQSHKNFAEGMFAFLRENKI